jgi:hypothetical protein
MLLRSRVFVASIQIPEHIPRGAATPVALRFSAFSKGFL